jgi:hypothetical protein
MNVVLLALVAGPFFLGVGVGCWCRWTDRHALIDELANVKDDRDKWSRRYAILTESVAMHLRDCHIGRADWWKDES